jgi:uncharacterized protein
MKISLDRPTSSNSISACRPDAVTIGGVEYRRSLLVHPDRRPAYWAVPTPAALERSHLDEALSLEPEILLLGTGRRLLFPPPALYAAVVGAGVGFEVMDTAAACRTFNILLAEDRRVVAALILEGEETA